LGIAFVEEPVEARVGIDLQHAAERLKMLRRVLALAVGRVRKLPLLPDAWKVELSGRLRPGGSNEEVAIHRDADRLDPEGSRRRCAGEGDLAEVRDQLGDLLQLEGEVRRAGGVAAEAAEGARGR